MLSINTNSSALTALQALELTQQDLNETQSQVSTGYAVNTAADNASYWSIATQLRSDTGVVTAANSALSQSQAVLSTASSAISSILTTINSIQTTLTQATNPGANITDINTSLASLGQQLADAVNSASFNGLNILNGTQTTPLNFVSGFNATSTGGTFDTINLTPQALTGAAGVTTTTQEPNITDATTIAALEALAPSPNGTTLSPTTELVTNDAANTGVITIQSEALDGTTTLTTYQMLDANGNDTTTGGAAVAALGVTVQTTTGTGLLTQNGIDITNSTNALQVTSNGSNAQALLTAVDQAQAALTDYSATIGATQDRMTSISNFNNDLTTNYANGISALVDADMNVASTRLQALQTQEQLGIQSLSIANSNSQLILKLFGD
ncbi:MAG TPA: flagellin [Methylocella sp.]|nr:flagellin [Methylocella sp.]